MSQNDDDKQKDKKQQKEAYQVASADDWLYAMKFRSSDNVKKNSQKRKDFASGYDKDEKKSNGPNTYDFGNFRTPGLNENLIDTIMRKPEYLIKNYTINKDERVIKPEINEVDRKEIRKINTSIVEENVKNKVQKKFMLKKLNKIEEDQK